ncbi:hypothetical protein QBC39DRAFT_310059 [Podospora conica]|nr:hypothetical protein QBC39DRAFT_310059 [Schizothecium conicum]
MIFSIPKALALVASFSSAASAAALPEPQRLVPLPGYSEIPQAWQARHGLTDATYQTAFTSSNNQGYTLKTVSGYTINDQPRFAAIWEKYSTRRDYVARHGLTDAAYQTAFNQYVNQGYRLRHVDGYAVGTAVRYAAIWDKTPFSGDWVARHGLTDAAYQAAFTQYVDQGYRLVHVSGYTQNNSPRFAAIFERPTRPSSESWVARHGLTNAQYQQAFTQYVNQGYRLLTVSAYVVNNVDYYAAIWDTSAVGGWVARHGLTNSQYQQAFNEYVDQGYRLTHVAGYTLNKNQDRYAAIFVRDW